MSDTPRADAECGHYDRSGCWKSNPKDGECVDSDFARQLERELNAAKARVAELEARVRDAEESNANALARLSAAEATIELKHAENQAARSQLWLIETACDALEKRFAELEALAKEAREDEAWANERTVLVEFQPLTSGWYASASDGLVGINATAPTIHGALRALREKVEARP